MTFESSSWERSLRALKSAVGAVAFLAVMGSQAYAQNVVIQGNQRVDAATIRSYAQGSSGEQIRQDLLATGLFSSVSVSQRGGQTIVSVKENDVVNRVVFQGNKKLKSDQLETEVQSKARGPFSRTLVDADVQRLKDVYQRSGRGLANVSARIVPLENGRVDIVFDIVEGEKTGVKAIDFSGNNAFSAGRLRDQMTTTESNLLSFLKNSDVYDPDRIAADLELLRRFYLKNGYADFRVVSNDVKFDEAAGGYRITIVVDEGQQYKVGKVDVESRIA